MNKELSKVLRQRIIDNGGVVFADKLFGLVQTGEKIEQNQNGNSVRVRFPIATESILNGVCDSHEQIATPDSGRLGIIYFEDNGTIPAGNSRSGNQFQFESRIRLVCWINRKKVTSETYVELTMLAITDLMKKIGVGSNPKSESYFVNMSVDVDGIPRQDAGIFNRYTYDETISQFLRPPYEFFALDLLCKYSVNPNCISEITLNESIC